jgi:polyphosphate kinase 2
MVQKKAKTTKKPVDEAVKDAKALAKAIAAYRIEDEELSPLIAAAAFGSGDYPYEDKMKAKDYERDLEALQIELLKALDWVRAEGERVVIVFEGRDAAGKGGAIHRVTQHLNPRDVRVVALSKPTPEEQGQWYFQRYAVEMPTKGEIVIFDRSWYNRAGVEPVMGFCTPEQAQHFLSEAPQFEAMLVREGLRLVKVYLTIGHEMQLKRLHARQADPLKRWKLSPIDYKAIDKWDAYSDALDLMLGRTDTLEAPWYVIKGNDKCRARLAVIRQILFTLPYPDKEERLVHDQDNKIALDAKAFLSKGGEE